MPSTSDTGFSNRDNQVEYTPFFSTNAHRLLCKNLDGLNLRMKHVRDDDKDFLVDFLTNPILKSILGCHDTIINKMDSEQDAESDDNIPLIKSLMRDLERRSDSGNSDAEELHELLSGNLYLRSLIDAHDTIAQKDFQSDDELINVMLSGGGVDGTVDATDGTGTVGNGDGTEPLPYYASPPVDAIRMIGIRKVNDEPLGITVRVNENGDLEIARIMHGGLIDKQALLHEGDIIKEVNGESVSTPEELQEKLKIAQGSVTLKVVPSFYDIPLAAQVYMKALFSYEPQRDKLIPNKGAGLAFGEGDVLQIISQEDIHWWQARLVRAPHMKGLIPSLYLEERRKAYVPHEQDLSKSSWACGLIEKKKKKKFLFSAKEHSMHDKADLKLYEEVARMPPFARKTLVLIGADGIGRRSFKTKLLNLDPDRFGTTIPHTSRRIRDTEENGRGYFFEDREKMERDISDGEYLEWGEHNENLYGTKLQTIRQVIQSGKMCVLDCSSKALKLLSNQDFMPYVVFVKCPPSIDDLYAMKVKSKNSNKFKNSIVNQSILNFEDYELASIYEESEEIELNYHAYFDLTVVNDDMNKCFASLVEAIDALRAEPQWVPVNWLY